MMTLDDDTRAAMECSQSTDVDPNASRPNGESLTSASATKTTATVKSYKVSDPLDVKPRRPHPGAQKTAEAMNAIGTYFSGDVVQDRENNRTVTSLLHFQLQSAQSEIHDLRGQVSSLTEKLFAETRRADQAQNELQFVKAMHEMSASLSHRPSHRRHHSSSSDSSGSEVHRSQKHIKRRRHSYSSHAHTHSSVSRSLSRSSSPIHAQTTNVMVTVTPPKKKNSDLE